MVTSLLPESDKNMIFLQVQSASWISYLSWDVVPILRDFSDSWKLRKIIKNSSLSFGNV